MHPVNNPSYRGENKIEVKVEVSAETMKYSLDCMLTVINR